MSYRRNPFQGIITINGKHFLARDIFDALLQLGVVVDVDESGLVIGYKRIDPLSDDALEDLMRRGELGPLSVISSSGTCNCQQSVTKLQEMIQHLASMVQHLIALQSRATMPPTSSSSARFKDQLSQVAPFNQSPMSPTSTTFFPNNQPSTSSPPLPPTKLPPLPRPPAKGKRDLASRGAKANMDMKETSNDDPWHLMDQLLPTSPSMPFPPQRHPNFEKNSGMNPSMSRPFIPSSPSIRCHSCKSPLPQGSFFCPRCGDKVRG